MSLHPPSRKNAFYVLEPAGTTRLIGLAKWFDDCVKIFTERKYNVEVWFNQKIVHAVDEKQGCLTHLTIRNFRRGRCWQKKWLQYSWPHGRKKLPKHARKEWMVLTRVISMAREVHALLWSHITKSDTKNIICNNLLMVLNDVFAWNMSVSKVGVDWRQKKLIFMQLCQKNWLHMLALL